jgi:hypothetical protein
MAICPVCEHAQQGGDECEVCGKRLVTTGGAAWQVEPVPGLEPTLAGPVEVAAERVEGLEPTRFDAALEQPAETSGAWMEQTAAAPVAAVDTEVPPGLEGHLAAPIPDGGPDLLAPTVCRYCRTTAAPGDRFCVRCGMRIPLFDARQVAAEILGSRCRECGAEGAGARCSRCGARRVSGS